MDTTHNTVTDPPRRTPMDSARSAVASIPPGLSRWMLGIWLIVIGLVPVLGVGSVALTIIVSLLAIATGILILLNR